MMYPFANSGGVPTGVKLVLLVAIVLSFYWLVTTPPERVICTDDHCYKVVETTP